MIKIIKPYKDWSFNIYKNHSLYSREIGTLEGAILKMDIDTSTFEGSIEYDLSNHRALTAHPDFSAITLHLIQTNNPQVLIVVSLIETYLNGPNLIEDNYTLIGSGMVLPQQPPLLGIEPPVPIRYFVF